MTPCAVCGRDVPIQAAVHEACLGRPDRLRLAFTVLGKAEPQGSASAFVPNSWARAAVAEGRTVRAVVTSDNPKNKGWRRDVAFSALDAIRRAHLSPPVFAGPVLLELAFYLPRPKSLKGNPPHQTIPDLDKVVRSIGDSLKGIAWLDDKQVDRIIAAKYYAALGTDPRVEIVVSSHE